MSVSFLLLLLFLLFSSFYFAKRKLRACLSKHSSIDAFASAALSPEIHMKDTCAFGNSDAQSIFSIVSMQKRQRNTQRCSLTRCKTKLLFAHFITKSGLIIIMGVWELPYNLQKVLRISQCSSQCKKKQIQILTIISPIITPRGLGIKQCCSVFLVPAETVHLHFYLLRWSRTDALDKRSKERHFSVRQKEKSLKKQKKKERKSVNFLEI